MTPLHKVPSPQIHGHRRQNGSHWGLGGGAGTSRWMGTQFLVELERTMLELLLWSPNMVNVLEATQPYA